MRVATFSSFPRRFLAMHLYFPASSSRTSFIRSRPSDVTLALSLGNDPLILVQVKFAVGFPDTEQEKTAVLLSLTVSCEAGEMVTFGAEIDSPGSPLIPGILDGPISPLIPFSPLIPGGPIIPCFPLLPGGPIIPWEPFLPLLPSLPLMPWVPALPGGPGRPRGQTLKFPRFWQIFKLVITISSRASFMKPESLEEVELEITRLNLSSLDSLFVGATR